MVKKVNSVETNKLVKKTDYNAKIQDIEDKIPSITGLATTTATALIAVENKIPDVSNRLKKIDYKAKKKTL